MPPSLLTAKQVRNKTDVAVQMVDGTEGLHRGIALFPDPETILDT